MNYLSLNQNQGIQYLNGYVSQEETNNKVTITYYLKKKTITYETNFKIIFANAELWIKLQITIQIIGTIFRIYTHC